MNNSINLFLIIIISSLFSGWLFPLHSFGEVSTKTLEQKQINRSIFHSSYYLKKSRSYIRNDELQLALLYLNIAAALRPDDMEIVKIISDLKLQINIKSNKYFKKGKKFYLQKEFEKARKQFLISLRYNPDHKQALDYLKNRLNPGESVNYTFKKNDSLKAIANKFYKDPEMVFLIAYFNNLKSNTEPDLGETLKIPVFELQLNQTIDGRRKDLISAKNLFKEKQFREVIIITQKILGEDPLNKEAARLKNEAFYQIGMQLSSRKKYFEAIDTFNKITQEYEGVNDAIQEAIQHELLIAEQLLKKKKFEESRNLAEKILDYDRSNTTARRLITLSICQQGKDLLHQKKYDEALHVLDHAVPVNNCAEKIRLSVKMAIKQQAEVHYIQGVKHFLNEELQKAIKEWERTLKLNPEHDKAKKNIKNARSLLEKLKKVK